MQNKMKIVCWSDLDEQAQQKIMRRPALNDNAQLCNEVSAIIETVQKAGDSALVNYSARFDNYALKNIKITKQEINQAPQRLSTNIKEAIQSAHQQVLKFHQAQQTQTIRVQTLPGVICEMHTHAIESVGLYIPGGSAPLPSTVIMTATPAQIAGCTRVVLCSPPPIADEILYAAMLCGVDEIYRVGGAQAIAALAYGTSSIARVDKIFGPGNAYVTEAKRQVNHDLAGASIDMPAGPSEVLIIADKDADPTFIAADLLSQAEHGHDSQVILLTPSLDIAQQTLAAIDAQLLSLPRRAIAEKALANSVCIICDDIAQALQISERYAPEHLIVQCNNARDLLPKLKNAGSIFLGKWTPEAVGDYASGTNHVLPTYGAARTYSSLGLADFVRRFSVQQVTPQGLRNLAPTVTCLASAEGLDAHRRAVTIRLDKLSAKGEFDEKD
ncbi:histidinol dehydrogenase [Psychromonas sp. CNPT3]|uniref:histidinol dehydrogenase n=1 Tax=Psychromonas sp. CNPT3 TaxID=314282 RepID=UPI00006E85BC|nr:histidinol dehydrogenase [Psychromonas sp. CNPT3]AGH81414.1 histidinol dehydrogenase [Psychromonas sp. CNPT3]